MIQKQPNGSMMSIVDSSHERTNRAIDTEESSMHNSFEQAVQSLSRNDELIEADSFEKQLNDKKMVVISTTKDNTPRKTVVMVEEVEEIKEEHSNENKSSKRSSKSSMQSESLNKTENSAEQEKNENEDKPK